MWQSKAASDLYRPVFINDDGWVLHHWNGIHPQWILTHRNGAAYWDNTGIPVTAVDVIQQWADDIIKSIPPLP